MRLVKSLVGGISRHNPKMCQLAHCGYFFTKIGAEQGQKKAAQARSRMTHILQSKASVDQNKTVQRL